MKERPDFEVYIAYGITTIMVFIVTVFAWNFL